MSSPKFAKDVAPLAVAVRELREALGETQEGMARRLGCTLSGYIQWEKGRRVPSGAWLLKLMALCPDGRTRRLFDEAASPALEGGEVGKRPDRPLPRSSSTTPEQRRRARAMAREAIDILYELGDAGHRSADQKLKSFADELTRAAGDLSRALRPRD